MTGETPSDDPVAGGSTASRRSILALVGATGIGSMAGCSDLRNRFDALLNEDDNSEPEPEPASAQRYRETVAPIQEGVSSAFRSAVFAYDRVEINPESTTDTAGIDSVTAVTNEARTGDRMWLTVGETPTEVVADTIRASLGLEADRERRSEVLNSTIRFTGSENTHGIFGYVGIHHQQSAVLIVRAGSRSTAEDLIAEFNSAAVLPD